MKNNLGKITSKRALAVALVGGLMLADGQSAQAQSSATCQTVGTCIGGNYIEHPSCPNPVGYAADAWHSYAMCGGVGNACEGVGYCENGSYCNNAMCYSPTAPLSQVMCGGQYSFGNGVGSCFGDNFVDDALGFSSQHPVSQLFCDECTQSQCGEIQTGCGVAHCIDGALQDSCNTYAAGSSLAIQCCPEGAQTFRKYYLQTSGNGGYTHVADGQQLVGSGFTNDFGFITAGFAGSGSFAMRTDRNGEVLWAKLAKITGGRPVKAVIPYFSGFIFATETHIIRTDGNGNALWAKTLPGGPFESGNALARNQQGYIVVAGVTPDNKLYVMNLIGSGSVASAKQFTAPSGISWVGSIAVNGADLAILAGNAGTNFLLRLNSAQQVVWAKTLPGKISGSYFKHRVITTSDGGFAAVTAINDVLHVSKVNSAGAGMWGRSLIDGGFGSLAIGERADGTFVVTSEHRVDGLFSMGLSSSGNLAWARTYGLDGFKNPGSGGVTHDGGTYHLTEIHKTGIPLHSLQIIRTDTFGRVPGCCDQTEQNYDLEPFNLVTTDVALTASALAFTPAATTVTMENTPREGVTMCAARSSYLCGGIETGDCLCNE